MRHNKDDKRFSRTGGHLRCMMANMTNSLIEKGRIQTTTPKAKMLRRYVERMITLGKSGSLPARRRAMAFMRSKSVVTRLFTEVAPRYRERSGGYTRILRTGFRAGDSAPMSIIELVEADSEKKAATPRRRTRTASRRRPTAKKAAEGEKAAPRKKAAPKKAGAKAAGEKGGGEKKKAPAKKTAAASKKDDKGA